MVYESRPFDEFLEVLDDPRRGSTLWLVTPHRPVFPHAGAEVDAAVDSTVVATVDTPSDGTNNRNHRDLVVRECCDGPILQMLWFDDDDCDIGYGRRLPTFDLGLHRFEHAWQFRHSENRVVPQTAPYDRCDVTPRRVPEPVGHLGEIRFERAVFPLKLLVDIASGRGRLQLSKDLGPQFVVPLIDKLGQGKFVDSVPKDAAIRWC